MPIAYIDANRGNDTTGDGTIGKPFRTLARVANWNAGANGGLLLARDSVFDIAITTTSNGQVGLTSQFNGAAGSRCFIGVYDPPGVGSLTSKPTIRRRMFPAPADWQWDATVSHGAPRGWYIQFSFAAAFWDARVKVAGVYAETTNQNTTSNTGLGYINGTQNGAFAGQFVNGMTADTLRFNFDYSGQSVGGQTGARLYLSGAGLRTPGAGNDPSSVVGPGQIEIAFGWAFSLYDGGSHCLIEDIRIESGGGLLLFQGTPDTVKGGLELRNCESFDTSIPIRLNNGTGTQAATVWPFDIHDNRWQVLTGPSFTAFGAGITGQYRNNLFEDGNLASSMGGGVYMQVKQSLFGGGRVPFIVRGNTARRWRNGAGNNEFDGCCYYIDLNDDGTVLVGNLAEDSFAGFQIGSGRRAEVQGNVALGVEQGVMMNNAPAVDVNDYRVYNNTFVFAARGTHTHGETAEVHRYRMPLYQVGTSANLVQIRSANNVLVNHPSDPAERPMLLGKEADWAAGKVSSVNDVFVGFGSRLLDSEFGANDRTGSLVGALTLQDASACGFADAARGDLRLTLGSVLSRSGVDVVRTVNDGQGGRDYQSPPSRGAWEQPTRPTYF